MCFTGNTFRSMRYVLVMACLLGAAKCWAQSSQQAATGFPSKPVRYVVTFAAGAAPDTVARLLAERLTRMWGHQVIVDNRVGVAGLLGAASVAKSPPDGYTLVTLGPGSLVYNKFIYTDVKYDADRDFAPVTLLTNAPVALYVNAAVPAQSIGEFIALAKAPGNKLNYGAPGHGHIFHLSMELFKDRSGTDIQFVPYKGSAPVVQDLVAGNIHAAFNIVGSQFSSLIKAGMIPALASGGDARLRDLPDLPTLQEAGVKDYYAMGGFAMYTTGGTPRDIVLRLNREMVKLATHPEIEIGRAHV